MGSRWPPAVFRVQAAMPSESGTSSVANQFRPLSDSDWPAEISDMLPGFAGKLNVYRTMAHHPALLRAWSDLREHPLSLSPFHFPSSTYLNFSLSIHPLPFVSSLHQLVFFLLHDISLSPFHLPCSP